MFTFERYRVISPILRATRKYRPGRDVTARRRIDQRRDAYAYVHTHAVSRDWDTLTGFIVRESRVLDIREVDEPPRTGLEFSIRRFSTVSKFN